MLQERAGNKALIGFMTCNLQQTLLERSHQEGRDRGYVARIG